MLRKLEKRLSKVEQYAAKSTKKPPTCNCKEATRFHNSVCLDELLKKMPRVCPVHGFQEVGFFLPTPRPLRLLPGDDQFCPCRADPLREFIEGPGRSLSKASMPLSRLAAKFPSLIPMIFWMTAVGRKF